MRFGYITDNDRVGARKAIRDLLKSGDNGVKTPHNGALVVIIGPRDQRTQPCGNPVFVENLVRDVFVDVVYHAPPAQFEQQPD